MHLLIEFQAKIWKFGFDLQISLVSSHIQIFCVCFTINCTYIFLFFFLQDLNRFPSPPALQIESNQGHETESSKQNKKAESRSPC